MVVVQDGLGKGLLEYLFLLTLNDRDLGGLFLKVARKVFEKGMRIIVWFGWTQGMGSSLSNLYIMSWSWSV